MVEVADFNCSDPDFLDHRCGIMPWNDLKSREVGKPETWVPELQLSVGLPGVSRIEIYLASIVPEIP